MVTCCKCFSAKSEFNYPSIDQANRANADAQKNIKKYQEQIKELQTQVEEEQKARDEVHEHFTLAEKRCNILQSERDEALVAVERVNRNFQIK